MLRILMLARPNLLTDPGGDTTQVFATARALRGRGYLVDINPEWPDYQSYNLLHFFNIGRIQNNQTAGAIGYIHVVPGHVNAYGKRSLIFFQLARRQRICNADDMDA